MARVMEIMNTVAMRAACSWLHPNASMMGKVRILNALIVNPKITLMTMPRPPTSIQAALESELTMRVII
ncbi:protein of unknown function [Thauera humireducens]|nr:protein of unknown function [Thauera humireducens]